MTSYRTGLDLHTYAILAAYALARWITYPLTAGEPDGKASRGYAAILRVAQRGLCAACGDALGADVEIAHVHAGTYCRSGWVGGNLYLAHIACNDFDARIADANGSVPLASLIRADLILMDRPSRKELLAAADAADADAVQADRNARRLAAMGG